MLTCTVGRGSVTAGDSLETLVRGLHAVFHAAGQHRFPGRAVGERHAHDHPGAFALGGKVVSMWLSGVGSGRNIRSTWTIRWGGSSSQFSLVIGNQDTEGTFEMSLYTSQAADMSGLILDYIHARQPFARGNAHFQQRYLFCGPLRVSH